MANILQQMENCADVDGDVFHRVLLGSDFVDDLAVLCDASGEVK